MISIDVRHREGRVQASRFTRFLAGFMLALASVVAFAPAVQAETRTLKLYFIHTKERAEITYKRNGRYLSSGLKEINRFLRDWRQNEPTNMDPQLLDLVWEVYRASGARDYIHVVSAYRSPKTNAMLRKRSSGVAKKSQHMLGKAMDFYIPGVKLSTLRNLGLKYSVGGVGYYPRSGSPFVHLDVGSVRHWPRMSRKELASVFPDGKTVHVPSDGKPLPGYKQALADVERRKRSGGSIQIAKDDGRRGKGLLAALFGGGADEEEDNAETSAPTAVARATPQRAVPQQAAPKPDPTPATILAALPARSLPVPQAAPRANISAGTQLALEQAVPAAPEAAPVAETQVAAAQPDVPDNIPFQTKPVEEGPSVDAETILTAANIPVPTRRPDYQAAESAIQLASAEEQEGALPATAFATPTRRPAAPEAINELLAQTPKQDAQLVAAAAPQPAPAPADIDAAPQLAAQKAQEKAEATLVAASNAGVDDEVKPAALAAVEADGAAKASGNVVASPRLAMLNSGGSTAAQRALASSARTTAKSAKPRPSDVRPQPKAIPKPVQVVSARHVLSRESVARKVEPTQVPAFNPQIAKAPSAVYTTGFQKALDSENPNRLTGKAITFLSVAKFATN
ncbi:DUF882 domain-containing protein [Nitratireductor basaltis]|uniref:Murein endopeptidase K n=1 Tax=Nitratireductor basaltis TaxID=472175 RepID=A0A084U854_9HYPH|nr:DUF882 domain-containing protein [Nitratireductor basaltis]KFB09140.1 hypothetical protein EL18_00155 [Nitratireductor basaltis]